MRLRSRRARTTTPSTTPRRYFWWIRSPDIMPCSEAVTITRTVAREVMTGMEHAPKIELLPNESLFFAPGGYHLMLLNPKRILRAGDRVDIQLEFRGGLVLPFTYEVRK